MFSVVWGLRRNRATEVAVLDRWAPMISASESAPNGAEPWVRVGRDELLSGRAVSLETIGDDGRLAVVVEGLRVEHCDHLCG
jgi:hypothetical protein